MSIMRTPLSITALLSLVIFISGCASVSDDPRARTPGVAIDDTFLETVVEREIRKSSPEFKGSHIVIVAYNGVVLLAGQVPSESAKQKATEVAQTLRRVKRVHNELTVGGPTSFFARSNDAWLTTKVKSRLVANKEIPGTKIKVQTENGTVFLLGLVLRADADKAVTEAQKVYGVQKIVKVFEYLD